MDASPLDLRYLKELTGSDERFLAELIEEFLVSANDLLGRITALLSAEDWTELKLAAHALKGSSRSIGSTALGEIAFRMEEESKRANKPELKSLLSHATAEYARIKTWWDGAAQSAA
jgi:HPt (histidine-containing phosphotransfer) domain-containing protein